jgi:hypothetical protein
MLQKFQNQNVPTISTQNQQHVKFQNTMHVATLALGSRPKQGLAKVWAKKEAWESHLMISKM